MPLHNPKPPVWSVAGKKKDVVLQIPDIEGLVAALASAGGQPTIKLGGALVGTRAAINFIEGSNVSLTITDDAPGDKVDVTVAAVGGSGSVSSIGVSAPDIFSVSGSPVTASGTIALSLVNQNANLFWAGPSSGPAALPVFRAIAAVDLPAASVSAQGAMSAAHFALVNSATSANTVSALVLRDASGNFAAGTITAAGLSSSSFSNGGTADMLVVPGFNSSGGGKSIVLKGGIGFTATSPGSVDIQDADGNSVLRVRKTSGISGVAAIGFFATGPVPQQTQTSDLKDVLVNYGLVSSTAGATPLDLDGGDLIAQNLTASGTVTTPALAVGEVTASGGVLASKRIAAGEVSASPSGTYATDASLGNQFNLSIGASLTLSDPTNGTDGQRLTWRIKQTAASLSLTLGSAFRFGTDITAAALSGVSGKTDYLTAIFNSADGKWDIVGFVRGF